MTNKDNNLGQYFTKNEYLNSSIYNLILNNSNIILEPSIGRGDLIDYILKNHPSKNIEFDLYK